MQSVLRMLELRWLVCAYMAVGFIFLMPAPSLAQPVSTSLRSVDLNTNIIGLGHRAWENNYLAVWDTGSAAVRLFSKEGFRIWSTEASIEGAVKTSITSMGVWPDGTTVAGGGARTAAGALAGFLLWLSPDGSPIKTVRTSPFVPLHLKVAPNGKLWALGRILNPPDAKTDLPHQMLRSFSKDGLQDWTALSRENFAKWPHPAVAAGMTISGDRVNIYLPSTGELIALSSISGEELSRSTINKPEGFQLRGMASKADGTIYLSGTRREKTMSKSLATYAKVDKGVAHWSDMGESGSSGSGKATTIVGSLGDDLVLTSGGMNGFQWRREP
ncbi:MAG: hypothetical protein ACK6DY_02240 [Acidobacteriota bacterium]